MEMNVRDDQKLVEIWLTNAEKIDPVLREGLKEIYAKYKTKKYMVAVFESGKGFFTYDGPFGKEIPGGDLTIK